MIQDIFHNATILIALLSIISQIFKNHEISPLASLKIRVSFGCLSGVLGILLMLNTVHVSPGIILDFRNVSMIISAIFGGPVSVLITSLMIALFRLLYFPFSTVTVIATAAALIIGLGIAFMIKKNIFQKRSWLTLTLFSLIISSICFFFIIPDRSLLSTVLLVYWASTSIVSYLLYLYMNHLIIANALYRKYRKESLKDPLTGLNNMRQFNIEMQNLIQNLKENDTISILLIDIDYFKNINDLYGHLNGNKVLGELGKILLSQCRGSTDVVSRNGGEEFSVLLLNIGPELSAKIAERIRHVIESHNFVSEESQTLKITVSIGVATYPDSNKDIDKLFNTADSALYDAKRTGRNKVVLAS